MFDKEDIVVPLSSGLFENLIHHLEREDIESGIEVKLYVFHWRILPTKSKGIEIVLK